MRGTVLGVALLVAASAHASPQLLALDDAYDCAITGDGTVVAATAGGLRIGARVVTALDGLPDTRVESLVLDRTTAHVTTRRGSADVDLASGRVSNASAAVLPPVIPTAFERYGAGIVRATARGVGRSCVATSDGLFVTIGEQAAKRIETLALPTGDVSAIAATSHGLFVGTFDRGLHVYDGARIATVPVGIPHINALAWDGTRNILWVATARGLVRCSGDRANDCRRIGDRLARHALLLLPDGRVIAGGDDGLDIVNGDTIDASSSRKRGARFRSVWSLARTQDGTVFAGTTSGIFFGSEHAFTAAPDRLARASMVDGRLPDDWVTALLVRGNELVVGTYNAGVVAMAWHDGTLVAGARDASLGFVNPGGITALADGSLAVCTMEGLRVGSFGAFHPSPALGRDVTGVATTDGGAWIASRRGVMLAERLR